MRFGFAAALVAAFCVPAMSLAQTKRAADLVDCDWRSRAEAIPEPWEDFSRTFASGEVRVTLLDLIEPAAGSLYIMVLSPPYSELGDRQCRLIGISGQGFSGIDFGSLASTYNPAEGLRLTINVDVPNQDFTDFLNAKLSFGIDQRLGSYDPQLEVSE